MSDTERGLYPKYEIERLNDPRGKHLNCPYFVLDLAHDPYARPALAAYAEACKDTYPILAVDIEQLLADTGTLEGS